MNRLRHTQQKVSSYIHLQLQLRTYMTSSSNLLKIHSRGILQNLFPEDKSPDLLKLFTGSPQTIYCGFDPTADSLHIGNLLPLLVLLHCQRAGHRPIALIGGATAQIGDPSGKTTDRPLIDSDTIEKNVKGIKKNIETIFKNHAECFHPSSNEPLPPLIILNNVDWYKNVNVVDFLCKVGRQFRMGEMLSRTSVQSRLNSNEGLCLTEFLYQVFQSFDWLHLHKKYDCTIQIGGNDQMGNILSGFEFVSKHSKSKFFGLTTPLVTSSTGDKLGKSAGNAIWLSPNRTSSFDLYQFFIRLSDQDAERFLKMFTFLSDDEIIHIMVKQKANPEKRYAHKALAKEVVKLVHGESGLKSALNCTEALYSNNIENLSKLSEKEFSIIFKGAPVSEFYFEPGTSVMDLTMKAGCFKESADAERIIKAGGVYINGVKVAHPEYVLLPGHHILQNNITVVRVGKKNYHIIKWLGMGATGKHASEL